MADPQALAGQLAQQVAAARNGQSSQGDLLQNYNNTMNTTGQPEVTAVPSDGDVPSDGSAVGPSSICNNGNHYLLDDSTGKYVNTGACEHPAIDPSKISAPTGTGGGTASDGTPGDRSSTLPYFK